MLGFPLVQPVTVCNGRLIAFTRARARSLLSLPSMHLFSAHSSLCHCLSSVCARLRFYRRQYHVRAACRIGGQLVVEVQVLICVYINFTLLPARRLSFGPVQMQNVLAMCNIVYLPFRCKGCTVAVADSSDTPL
jgi:hypothetical protein